MASRGTPNRARSEEMIAEFPSRRARLRTQKASMGPRSIDRGVTVDYAALADEWGASMGPRSIDRGVTAKSSRGRRESLLQWGRDQLIAEVCDKDQQEQPSRNRNASMGPRSIDRGVARILQRGACDCFASMGPRSIDRGVCVTVLGAGLRPVSFNGAAIN